MLRIFGFRCNQSIIKPLRLLVTQLNAHSHNMSTQGNAGIKNAAEKLPRIKPPGPPKVWQVIEKVNNDGQPIKFTIQEIPEDRYEDAVQHMCTYFLEDEVLCASLNAKKEPAFVNDCSAIWRQVIQQGISVAAFVNNPDGGKPIIAGMNTLGIDFQKNKTGMKDFIFTSQDAKNVFAVITELHDDVGIYNRYKVEKYMFAFGLSVAPAYRGHRLSVDILKSREKIGREYDVSVTSTAFTSVISQKQAVRAGFELLLTKDYKDMKDENGKLYFPNVKATTLHVMARRLF